MPFSGPSWVSQFPGSHRLEDLVEPFRTNVQNFVDALQAAGAEVTISATLRPPQRAHLMHYSFQVAKGICTPQSVATFPGVDIQWVHLDATGAPDHAGSITAAAAMVAGYDIVFAPVLESRHTQGLAVDMTISWIGDLTMTDGNGLRVTISTLPRNGGNADLHGIGETYGVIKLLTDPPHWSSDGH